MDLLSDVKALHSQGRFAEALRQLDKIHPSTATRQATDVVRIDLLEHVGRYGRARALALELIRSNTLSDSHRATCELVLARVEREDGRLDSSVTHLQKAVSFAARAQDTEYTCWLQLRLLRLVSELSRPEAASGLLSEIRKKIREVGNTQLTAALHVVVGEIEAKRGLTDSSRRHTRLGLRLLDSAPNLWLQADAEITNAAIAIMLSDFDAGVTHASRARDLSDESGRAPARRASLANLGNLLYAAGDFDEAVKYYNRAIDACPSSGDNLHAVLDSIARVELARGHLSESDRLIDSILSAVQTHGNRRAYAYRYATLTRTQLLARQGRLDDALASADLLLQLSDESGDHLLARIALLTKTELLQDAGRTSDAMATLDSVTDRLAQLPPELYAHYEGILASVLVAQGDLPAAATHIARARRLYEGLRSAPALLDLARRWDEVTKRSVPRSAALRLETTTDRPDAAARNVLQTVAALLRHHGRLELVARELVYLLGETGSVVSAQAVSTSDNEGDAPQVLASVTAADTVDAVERRMPVGIARDRALSLVLKVRPDADSIATATAVRLLLTTVQDLERARADREERLSLWPADDEPTEPGQAVSVGQMHGLMESARRIASSPVSVFITGESGTGKEVLARAIHRFSDKADKPFIAFNCTAVPREMLESQLFGYRKGSFTGADRDHPGMIGAARGGTLFLDEIGELGLDLQPKLLRFLESNEICPIGESVPFTVNVRVIAATNANVEQLVSAGRFREDLFYRLNVFRLRVDPLRERREEIPPLVRYFLALAIAEFKKGDVRVAEDTMEHLLLCRWPGNVRQLQNEIRRMVALAEPHSVLTPNDLSPEVFNARLAPRAHAGPFELTVPLRGKLAPTLAIVEREMLKRALSDHHGKVDDAARALGLSRKGLYLKRQRLGL